MTPASKLFVPVCIWVLLQMVLLAIGVSGLPLWAHHPLPRESLALPVMLSGQVILFSMLFPMLATTGRGLAVNVALTLPYDQLAGILSNTGQNSIAMGWLCVGLWVCALGCVRHQMQLITLATLFTVGGAILDYLRWEAFLVDGHAEIFAPLSFVANLCLMNWNRCMLQAATALAICALITFLLKIARYKQKVTPLRSTAAI